MVKYRMKYDREGITTNIHVYVLTCNRNQYSIIFHFYLSDNVSRTGQLDQSYLKNFDFSLD